jgi:hypothetical protein
LQASCTAKDQEPHLSPNQIWHEVPCRQDLVLRLMLSCWAAPGAIDAGGAAALLFFPLMEKLMQVGLLQAWLRGNCALLMPAQIQGTMLMTKLLTQLVIDH